MKFPRRNKKAKTIIWTQQTNTAAVKEKNLEIISVPFAHFISWNQAN